VTGTGSTTTGPNGTTSELGVKGTYEKGNTTFGAGGGAQFPADGPARGWFGGWFGLRW
jgi:hypothetical protein